MKVISKSIMAAQNYPKNVFLIGIFKGLLAQHLTN